MNMFYFYELYPEREIEYSNCNLNDYYETYSKTYLYSVSDGIINENPGSIFSCYMSDDLDKLEKFKKKLLIERL